MDYGPADRSRDTDLIALFEATFAASEGAEEGRVIGALVRRFLSETPDNELQAFTASDGNGLTGGILFTRLSYPRDRRRVVLLSPVAVAPEHQGKGVGQALIRHGLAQMHDAGADVAITYGDPRFYTRVGFAQITEDIAKAPLPLSYPEGWLGQSLTDAPLTPLKGPSTCAAAINDPAYW